MKFCSVCGELITERWESGRGFWVHAQPQTNMQIRFHKAKP